MKLIFITLTLVIVIGSTFYMLLKQPNNQPKLPVVDKPTSINAVKSVQVNVGSSNTAQVKAINVPAKSSSTHLKESSQVNVSVIAGNSAAQFNSLPKEMQEEIKRLNGRNNKNAKPIEVEPGVFLIPAGKGVNSVPVAVINEDGTVSIHEY